MGNGSHFLLNPLVFMGGIFLLLHSFLQPTEVQWIISLVRLEEELGTKSLATFSHCVCVCVCAFNYLQEAYILICFSTYVFY